MIMRAAPVPHDGCPDQQTLLDFNRGRLSEPTLDAIGKHLSACGSCIAALSEIQKREAEEGFDARLRPFLIVQLPKIQKSGTGGNADWQAAAVRAVSVGNQTKRDGQLVGSMFGPYRLLEVIGAGGMGVVYRAEQVPIGQIVALKTITSSFLARPERVTRFRKEVAALARIRHPNVVQLYHFDEDDGRLYFTMELMDGGSLAGKLAQGPLDLREAVKLVKALAEAVGAAHCKEILHRDLKPSNVLLDANGNPKIADFGLAKLLDDDTSGLTASDTIQGTPNYMAVEQAMGRTQDVSERTDVYALGAILYECLTGMPPYTGQSKREILRKVCETEAVRPSVLRPDVPCDLEEICLKCLEKSPAARYGSAQQIADDLSLWFEGERPRQIPGRFNRLLRPVRRRPQLAVIVAACLIASLVGVALTRDPNGPIREAKTELAAGKTVTLIGETGRPRWLRFLTAEDKSRKSLASDGTFAVHTWGTAIMELLDDPQTDFFRLTAEVRHDKSDPGACVGVYVGRHAYPGGQNDVHFFVEISFNDARRPQVPPFNIGNKPLPPPPSRVCIFPHLHSEAGVPPDIDLRIDETGPAFQAVGEGATDWRHLDLVVSPSGVQGTWDSLSLRLDSHQHRTSAVSAINKIRSRPIPLESVMRQLRPEFSPRGGLGLYLSRGSASFRSVKVTPLPPHT